MKFLTSESDFLSNENTVMVFYLSDLPVALNNILFDFVSSIKNNVLCIDTLFFRKMIKRFNITEIPTILKIENGIEIYRSTGFPAEFELEKLSKP